MSDEFKRCANCRERIELINFSMGPEWRHWPTPYGNYRTNEKYRYCKTSAVATPEATTGKPSKKERAVADPIIPSTAEVRADYIRDHTRNFDSYQTGRSLTSEQEFYGEKFDRWLAAHDAEKRAEWGAELTDEYLLRAPGDLPSGATRHTEAETLADLEYVRRRWGDDREAVGRKVAPWIPVGQDTNENGSER